MILLATFSKVAVLCLKYTFQRSGSTLPLKLVASECT